MSERGFELAVKNAADVVCEVNPIGHDWQGLACGWCGEARTPTEAIVSGLASRRGGDEQTARVLLDAYRAQVLREAADMVDAAGDTCYCDDCQVSRDNAAALRHEADVTAVEAASAPQPADTLPAWLHQRFGTRRQRWGALGDGDRAYWEHESRAVRRAVARNGFKNPEPQTAPVTERALWQRVADALNACEQRGMPVGVDLDGTLTDHNTWSVVWNREVKRWELADHEGDGLTFAEDLTDTTGAES